MIALIYHPQSTSSTLFRDHGQIGFEFPHILVIPVNIWRRLGALSIERHLEG